MSGCVILPVLLDGLELRFVVPVNTNNPKDPQHQRGVCALIRAAGVQKHQKPPYS